MSFDEELVERVRERTDLIARATSMLHSDERVVAVWLAGSIGRGDADAYSDIDLWVVIWDNDMDAVREGRRQFVEVLGRPILISEAPQNAPPGGAYLWTFYPGKYGPQHVDWNWLPETNATIPADAQVLFDKAGLAHAEAPSRKRPSGEELATELTQEAAFFWGMCAVVAKYIARGRRYDVLNLMQIKWLLGEGELKSYKESLWDEVPLLIEPIEQLGLLREIGATMEIEISPKVEAAGGQVPREAIEEAHSLFDLVERALGGTEERT
jgi:predicted nucleotidyltransferase